MTQGYWVILEGLGGELDREFCTSIGKAQYAAAAKALNMEDGDTLRIVEGESEQD